MTKLRISRRMTARLLQSHYGIATAEAFYQHAFHEPSVTFLTALGLKKDSELEKLVEHG